MVSIGLVENAKRLHWRMETKCIPLDVSPQALDHASMVRLEDLPRSTMLLELREHNSVI